MNTDKDDALLDDLLELISPEHAGKDIRRIRTWKNGELKRTKIFVDGELVSTVSYFKNGVSKTVSVLDEPE